VVAYRDAAFGINGDHAGESFARYLLTRLLAQDPGLVYRMLVIIVTQAQWDNRQGALQLRKGACLLFGRIVERNRSTTRCYISFYDELSGIRFRNHRGMPHRFAFTVQHVISIALDGWIPLSLTQSTVHFCHLRNCCRPGHFYWNTAANNRCRDTCRIRGFSFYRLNQEDRRVICFCPHEPRCLILRNEFGMPEVPDERAMRRANRERQRVYRLNQEDRRVICFCPQEPRCVILRNELGMPDERAMRRANRERQRASPP
jgi:hypothetical protein